MRYSIGTPSFIIGINISTKIYSLVLYITDPRPLIRSREVIRWISTYGKSANSYSLSAKVTL